MLNTTTKRSKALSAFLFYRKSFNYDIGIIDNKYYSINRHGSFMFDLRADYAKDNSFPGIRETKRKISTKKLLSIFIKDRAENEGFLASL